MAKINVLNLKGEKVKDLNLNDNIWNIEINEPVLAEAIILQRASLRQGTASTKTRAEVSGTGRKPWRQKGTGNARQGSKRSPQWPGGGIVFGPKPRDYGKKLNKKVRRLALKSALTDKFKNKNLFVLEDLNIKSNKTKDLIEILNSLKINNKSLIITNDENSNLELAVRNNRNITKLTTDGINVLDIVLNENLIIDESSVKKLEEVLK